MEFISIQACFKQKQTVSNQLIIHLLVIMFNTWERAAIYLEAVNGFCLLNPCKKQTKQTNKAVKNVLFSSVAFNGIKSTPQYLVTNNFI